MSQGSHVPNFKALGAPKSKWQAITHTTTRQTHLEFKVKVSNLKPSQKDDHTQQQLQQQTTADNTHTHTRTEATAILAMHNNAFRVKNLRIWNKQK